MKYLIIFFLAILSINVNAAKSDCSNSSDLEKLVVIIDLSDTLDEPSKYAFKSLANKIAKIAPPGGILDIYDMNNISPNKNSSELSVCVPSFTSLTGEKLKQRKEKEFLKSVELAFDRISSSNNSAQTTSPVIESIYKIIFNAFNTNGISQRGRLIVISDFEQNTKLISFYKNDIPNYKDWKSLPESKAWLVSMPSVKFTSVIIQRAQKNSRVNLEKLRLFWLDYANSNFSKCGFIGLSQAAVELKNECN